MAPLRLDGDGPLYQQIGRAVRRKIVDGLWAPGTKVPSEHALMQQFGASRMTVHRALAELAADGLIERRRRLGTIVAAPSIEHAVLDILSIPDEVESSGRAYAFTILARSTGRADAATAALFRIPGGRRVLRLRVLHTADGVPHVIEDRVILLEAVPEAANESFDALPPGTWLLRNVAWTRAEHAISAVPAGRDEAKDLRIAVGSACLLVERRTWQGATPLTAVRFLYPGERHRFVGGFGPYEGSGRKG